MAEMKFQFKIQPYQTEAVEAVARVFSGQPHYERTSYTRDLGSWAPPVTDNQQLSLEEDDLSEVGYKNAAVDLSDAQLLENIRAIQQENNIHTSTALARSMGRCSLDIEMETGTGKTYVYIKTMFELNKRYGWSKFIVVVPSIAIREGVKKTFQMTEDHFQAHYGKKARYFVYSSKNLSELDSYSQSGDLSVMIINTQAFNTSFDEEKSVEGRGGDAAARIIFKEQDSFHSRRPVDVIRANRPIIIMDEPQKMGGEKTQSALKKFDPLFLLNYSATHKQQHDLVYVLDALDAYNKRLVKKIEVKGLEVKNLGGTNQYLYLERILLDPKKPPRARMEIEVSQVNRTARKTVILEVDDSVFAASNGMEQYRNGFTVTDIEPIHGTVTFSNGTVIRQGEALGDVTEEDIRRVQIRETIASHFEKEEALFDKGIKTLSLFFIDEVAKYRQYDEDGNELLGEYGRIFEEEYLTALNERRTFEKTPYQAYLEKIEVRDTHKGYFSIDKKTNRFVDSTLKRGSEFSDDISAYDLILKNKERLLSFEEPTRFIFSHSALREGWDNPNVFQICTLKHSDSQVQKRQEVGRGLRLCVDQTGARMDAETCGERVHEINKLTVVASDSYAGFVSGLQADIRKDLYDRPTAATKEYFKGKYVTVEGKSVMLDDKAANAIDVYLLKNGYTDAERKVTDKYRADLALNTLAPLPAELAPLAEGIHTLVQAVFDESVLEQMIQNGKDTIVDRNDLNENFYKKEFQTLWSYINHKYAYTVSFDSAELIQKAVAAIDRELFVSELTYTLTQGEQAKELDVNVLERGDTFHDVRSRTRTLKKAGVSQVKYDLVGKIAANTKLTRKTVVEILKQIKPEKFDLFRANPEEFLTKTSRIITEQKAAMVIEHITYDQIEGQYDSTIFTEGQTSRSISEAFRAKKHIQDYVFTDGYAKDGKSTERTFAEKLDTADEVCVYAKLPRGFQIPTPVGNYAPDWAIAFRDDADVKHIYFVAETKGSMESLNLRKIEEAKIKCAEQLFNRLSTSQVRYGHVNSYEDLLRVINGMS